MPSPQSSAGASEISELEEPVDGVQATGETSVAASGGVDGRLDLSASLDAALDRATQMEGDAAKEGYDAGVCFLCDFFLLYDISAASDQCLYV